MKLVLKMFVFEVNAKGNEQFFVFVFFEKTLFRFCKYNSCEPKKEIDG